MSKPAAKTARQRDMERIREENRTTLVNIVKKDLKAEKNAERKKNIQACLAELDVKKTYITGDQCMFAIKGKATKIPADDYTKKYDALDAQSQKLWYCVVGLHSHSHSKSMFQRCLTMFV